MTKTIILILCLSLSVMATTYYVKPTGDDSWSGTSPDSAFGTVGHICSTATSPGDTAYFLTGEWDCQRWLYIDSRWGAMGAKGSGTADSFIVFYVHPDSTVIIKGDTSASTPTIAIYHHNYDYVEYNGFTCIYSSQGGIRIGGSPDRVIVKNCECYHNVDPSSGSNGGGVFIGFQSWNTYGCVVESCVLHDNYIYPFDDSTDDVNISGVHIYDAEACTVRYNTIYNQPNGYGVRFKWIDTTCVAYGNKIHDCHVGVSFGSQGPENKAYNNLVWDCEDTGILIHVSDSTYDYDTRICWIYNNTVFSCNKGIGWYDGTATDSACSIFNNIVLDCDNYELSQVCDSSQVLLPEIIDYNCYYDYDVPTGNVIRWDYSSYWTLTQLQDSTDYGDNSVQVDPVIDTVRANSTFGHLTDSSPSSVKTAGRGGSFETYMGAFEPSATTSKWLRLRK